MRLLNVETRKVQEFVDNVPDYAILSHTWGDDEVTFQDLEHPDHTKKRGYTKIDGLCCLAAQLGFEWVWVDTCCIDKRSSAELSEAINSMYRWYKDASICYAYLEDVRPEKCPAYVENDKSHTDLDWHYYDYGYDYYWSSSSRSDASECPEAFLSHFGSSRWFTRGWTLQELLAPQSLCFFNAAWKQIGTRSSLAHRIESITSIPVEFLRRHPYPDFRKVKVAVRMSWAARRETTRVEDGAYSLLGIFDVNMPLLYGEGDKAFERLQLEILKESPDDSILAWMLPRELGLLASLDSLDDRPEFNVRRLPDPRTLLASSPQDFDGWLGTHTKELYETRNQIVEMTNRGLRITLPLVKGQRFSYGVLNCTMDNTFDKILAVKLLRSKIADEYRNAGLVILSLQIAQKCQKKTIHCVKPERFQLDTPTAWGNRKIYSSIRIQPSHSIRERLVGVIPKNSYRKEWSCVLPWGWQEDCRMGQMGRILLHYKQDSMDDKEDHESNGDGFVVILRPRSALSVFFSFEVTSPPFVCHTLPMPKGERLEHFLSRDEYYEIYKTPPDDDYRNLSESGSRFPLKSGVPRAWIRRGNKLDRDPWVVSIHKTQSLAEYAGSIAKPITKLRSFSGPQWFRWSHRHSSFGVNDLPLGLVPVIAWWLNNKRRRAARSWKEDTTCCGLVLILYLLRYKAHLALLCQQWPLQSTRKFDFAGFYHRVIYVPFALWFPFAMYTLFPRSRKEAKVNPLVSVLSSLAIVILARRGQKFL